MLDPELSDPVKQLRATLKEWEKVFATANGGRKAARDDIKKAPEIGRHE
jgi:DNA replication and checkpoint protein